MTDLPTSLYLSQDIKELEKQVIKRKKISAYALMQKAGQAAFQTLIDYWPHVKTITVFCGPGNNGGDGFVLSALAKTKGLGVTVYQVGCSEKKQIPEEAKKAKEACINSGNDILDFEDNLIDSDVIVDALLGTGARTLLPESFQRAIRAINQSQIPTLSIDIPSGINADTGNFEYSVKASVTLTLMAMKVGLVSGAALDRVGKIVFDGLGVDPTFYSHVKPCAEIIAYETLIKALPLRSLTAHKGDNGHILIIGGGQACYSGAVCLAGEAALRAGGGLVSAVVAPESMSLLSRAPAELMCYGFHDLEEFIPLLDKASVIVLGPGLGQNEWSERFFKASVTAKKPLVVDADGLNWLARFPTQNTQWVLTPHPKEAARLLGKSIEFIQENRLKSALLLQEKFQGVIVLKGAGTVIVDTDREVFVNAGGFPALATAGTGDVLAGLIGGLIGQKISLSLAARMGVSVHTHAAQCEEALGDRGMLASDLFLHIRTFLNPSRIE